MPTHPAYCYSANEGEYLHLEAIATDLLRPPRSTPRAAMPKVLAVTPKPGRRNALLSTLPRRAAPAMTQCLDPVEGANRSQVPAALVDCFLFR